MTLLPQITKSLNKGMKALGFTRASETRSYCISVNEDTYGFVDFCTSTFAVEGRVIYPIVSVANKPANDMLRTVVERTEAPECYRPEELDIRRFGRWRTPRRGHVYADRNGEAERP